MQLEAGVFGAGKVRHTVVGRGVIRRVPHLAWADIKIPGLVVGRTFCRTNNLSLVAMRELADKCEPDMSWVSARCCMTGCHVDISVHICFTAGA
ncbi:Uncharacterised protein [Mycobacteroides abscessus subsp. massiliense]|nr:Uncharacterised protein [Mycobacteroides abscessus subsp. massiliense]SKM20257.1 Uncharacterised protein [Mycobacteroides abscessus subsp. massiliense]